MTRALAHLRTPSGANDKAILDTLQLLELGRVPGWIDTKELEQLWGVSQSQVSRRLRAVHLLGIVKTTTEHGRTFLSRHGHSGDVLVSGRHDWVRRERWERLQIASRRFGWQSRRRNRVVA